jgi:PhnB protein
MSVHPYLFLEGNAEEAIEFYKAAVGAKVNAMMRIGDSPEPNTMVVPGNENKLLHAEFQIGDSLIWASDGFCSGKPKFEGVRLTLTCADAAATERAFAALATGGEVHQPLISTFFSPAFGMLADRFGVPWMILSAAAA